MDWIARINAKLEDLGLYPDVEAYDISDLAGHLVLVDTQEAVVYRSAEGVYRLLASVEPDDDEHETLDLVGQALYPNLVEEVRVYEDSGLWRVDHLLPETAAQGGAPMPDLATALSEAFDRLGWSSTTAPTGERCVEAFPTETPAIVMVEAPDESLLCYAEPLLSDLDRLRPPLSWATLTQTIRARRVQE